MFMEGVITYPISKILDCALGEHCRSRYQNKDLKALIELHSENTLKGIEIDTLHSEGMGLSEEQANMIKGVIDMSSFKAGKVMRKYDQVKKISIDRRLTKEFFEEIKADGHSRYPVYRDNPHNIVGILLMKRLLGTKVFGQTLTEMKVKLRKPLVFRPEQPLNQLLVQFKKGKSHMALITNQVAECQKNLNGKEKLGFADFMDKSRLEILGIITLEDVVEKLIGGYFRLINFLIEKY